MQTKPEIGHEMPELILASASPRRQELLRLLGFPFRVMPSKFDESVLPEWPPDEHVLGSASGKAKDVAEEIACGIVVGADTIVVVDGEILGKPEGPKDARRMLRLLSGRAHYVYTGLCVLQRHEGRTLRCEQGFERTEVRFGVITNEIIDSYVATGEPMDKAGAYGIQERGSVLVEGITGDYFNVVGLPIYRLSRMLMELGIPPFSR